MSMDRGYSLAVVLLLVGYFVTICQVDYRVTHIQLRILPIELP